MKATEITAEEIRRIPISCSCGAESIAEVPGPFARLTNVHLCPGCGAIFAISEIEGSWKIERVKT
jgi:hypothetical protein